MAEYIKRKALVDLVLGKLKFMGDARIMNKGDEKVLSEIDGYEKAIYAVHELLLDKDLIEDIQPAKRGKLEERIGYGGWGDTYYHCSVCGSDWVFEKGTPKANEWSFCPHCGADVRGDENA